MRSAQPHRRTHGTVHLGGGRYRFVVWAPGRRLELHLLAPVERWISMTADEWGYHTAHVDGVPPGALYRFRVDGVQERPDPASRFQPQGVHGPSAILDSAFTWTDGGWRGLALHQFVLYEIHVGTFTPEGTLDAAIAHLDGLAQLGVTAVELMPVAQFPGTRNWGYDGVFPYAVQDSYGGPVALKRFVDACHTRGLAVVLDVVYNHLGPEGNPLWGLAHHFTERYRTPWGAAMNFDGAGCDPARWFFIDSALGWIREFHVDGLRLDAVHAIVDVSAYPFLQELAEEVHAAGRDLDRDVVVIAESDRNDPRLIAAPPHGGYGLDGVWNDDFHHALHALLTGERQGYYQDFGALEQMARALDEGYVFAGQYSRFRERRHGASSRGMEPRKFVVFAQNHDQVGNRMLGERLSRLVSFEQLKLAVGIVLLSPNIPLLFMGEEYGETAPFLYFVSHSDAGLVEAVWRGRKEEFAAFRESGEPPDPKADATFRRSQLNRALLALPRHQALRELYRTLIALRRDLAGQGRADTKASSTEIHADEQVLMLRRDGGRALAAFNFSGRPALLTPQPAGGLWRKVLGSADERWHGPGCSAPETFAPDGHTSLVLQPASIVLYRLA
ncbi:MAG: malto-oligosyltrehalose trehalohydrolase [Candidatus Lambdaproteobacteria bacterium]|nr:malto-oligosyltrehalose trehalohydrolase [Candidatus Lambdaproteobacteria bacterium]